MNLKTTISFVFLLTSFIGLAQTTSENYIKTTTYTESTTVSDSTKANTTVQYFDGLGRPIQIIAHKQSPTGQDIITPIEYDDFGRQTKEYLPYASDLTPSLDIVTDPLGNQNQYYSSHYGTDKAFSEKQLEASPLNRVLKQGAPGDDWQIDNDHSIKFDYQTNQDLEVLYFKVVFDNPPSTIEHHLEKQGYYEANQLYKTITKDENWQPGQNNPKDHTTVEYKNKLGQVILKRTFNNNIAHDTYYVYDDYGNLTYVLPPKVIKPLSVSFSTLNNGSIFLSWARVANVNQDLADSYDRALEDYDNQTLLDADLYNEFGGQGGVTLSVVNKNLQVDINISTQDPMALRNGYIADLRDLGSFRDTEIGRLTGTDYSYNLSIRENQLYIEGSGRVSQLIANLNSSTRLSYQKNLPWFHFVNIDEQERAAYEEAYSDIAEADKLTTYVENPYGAIGGASVIVDDQDNVSFSMNLTSNTPLQLKSGVALNLDLERTLASRQIYAINAANLDYNIKLINNNINIEGGGDFTSIIDPPGSGGTTTPPPAIPNAFTVPQHLLDGLCYIYTYDHKNNLVKKKIPGKGWERIIYDKLNRPVLTQDANLKLENKWLFTKYDVFDRPVYTGIVVDNRTRDAIQTELYDNTNGYALAEEKVDASQTFTQDNLDIYYSNQAFPTSNFEVLTVNYYDDYNFNTQGIALNTSGSAKVPIASNLEYNASSDFTDRTKTLSTGSHVKVLDTNHWITTVTLYDDKARPIYTHSKNDFLNTEDISNIKLNDFLGLTLETHNKHIKFDDVSNTTTTTVIVDKFTYNEHNQSLEKQTQQINGQAEELIVFNKYDELGQLIEKKVGGNDTQSDYDQTTALQDITYDYNIRGWLTDINDVDNSSPDKLFAFNIRYNNPEDINTQALYNGNISETHWRTQNTSSLKRSYGYEYDALNRLNSANYLSNHSITLGGNTYQEDFFEGNITYDPNGNILQLTRKGVTKNNQIDIIDQLSYDYFSTSNQLSAVGDTADDNGFKDGNTSGNDYTYDANGNMTKDKNKDIINIEYNHLNLPKKVEFATQSMTGKYIEYVYDATGVKLEKRVQEENLSSLSYTYYQGAYIYEKSTFSSPLTLKFISQPEGYIEPNVTSSAQPAGGQGVEMDYVYQFKDHLGNIRLSYKELKDLESHFTNSKDGWQNAGNVTSTLENGRLKVNVDSAWEGIKQNFNGGLNTAPGEEILINLKIDKANTQSKIRILVQELDSNNNHISWNTVHHDLQTGSHSLNYTVNTGDKIKLKIDKVNTHTNNLTYFYVDHVIVSRNELQIIEENNYYPFGLKHKGYNYVINGQHYPYGYNGKEENDELGLEWLDFGSRGLNASLGRWFNIDAKAELYFNSTPYSYVRNSPVMRIDPNGNWDITVHVAKNRNENGYGIAVVTNRHGNEIYRFKVRVEGTGGRNRFKKNADTPLGFYDIPDNNMWKTGGSRESYGPNPRLILTPISGEILDSKRKYIRIHGGRQEFYNKETGLWEKVNEPNLKKTYGCLRCYDTDILTLKSLVDQLMGDDPDEYGGVLKVIDDLKKFNESEKDITKNIQQLDEVNVIAKGGGGLKPSEPIFQDLNSLKRPNTFGNTGKYNKQGRTTDNLYSDEFLKWYYDK